MANQYSITVSEDTDRILNEMKKSGYKVSQVIDAAIKTLQQPALARAVALERRVKTLEGDQEWSAMNDMRMSVHHADL